MKRFLLAVTLFICVILSGCLHIEITIPESHDTSTETPETTQPPTVDVRDYPSAIGSNTEKLMMPIIPNDVFGSTAEENGLGGTLYKIYGTVTDITEDSSGNLNVIHLHTHKGNVIISNIAVSMAAEYSFSELGKINTDTIATLCPMPEIGEFCRIYAEYQGYSEKYQAPYFIYGGIEYLTDVIINSLE